MHGPQAMEKDWGTSIGAIDSQELSRELNDLMLSQQK